MRQESSTKSLTSLGLDLSKWILVISGMMIAGMRAWTERCISVFYIPLMMEFGLEFGEVSQLIGMFFIGYGMAGVTSGAAVKRFGSRRCIVVSATVSCVSIVIASVSGKFWCIVVFYGFIPGACFQLQIIGVFTIITKSFRDRLQLANQLVFLGYSIGSFIGCPINHLLIDTYNWDGALMIIAGIVLNITVLGSLMRSRNIHERQPDTKCQEVVEMIDFRDVNEKPTTSEVKMLGQNKNGTLRRAIASVCINFDLILFKKLKFYLAVFTYAFHATSIFSSMSFLVPYGTKGVGLSETKSAFLPTAIASGEMLSRILYGFFFVKIPRNSQKIFVVSQFLLLSGLFVIIPSLHGFVPLMILCACIGLIVGGIDGMYSTVVFELFGVELYSTVFSYTNVISFTISTGAAILIGTMVDLTGNLSCAFYFGGVSYALAALTLFALHKRSA